MSDIIDVESGKTQAKTSIVGKINNEKNNNNNDNNNHNNNKNDNKNNNKNSRSKSKNKKDNSETCKEKAARERAAKSRVNGECSMCGGERTRHDLCNRCRQKVETRSRRLFCQKVSGDLTLFTKFKRFFIDDAQIAQHLNGVEMLNLLEKTGQHLMLHFQGSLEYNNKRANDSWYLPTSMYSMMIHDLYTINNETPKMDDKDFSRCTRQELIAMLKKRVMLDVTQFQKLKFLQLNQFVPNSKQDCNPTSGMVMDEDMNGFDRKLSHDSSQLSQSVSDSSYVSNEDGLSDISKHNRINNNHINGTTNTTTTTTTGANNNNNNNFLSMEGQDIRIEAARFPNRSNSNGIVFLDNKMNNKGYNNNSRLYSNYNHHDASLIKGKNFESKIGGLNTKFTTQLQQQQQLYILENMQHETKKQQQLQQRQQQLQQLQLQHQAKRQRLQAYAKGSDNNGQKQSPSQQVTQQVTLQAIQQQQQQSRQEEEKRMNCASSSVECGNTGVFGNGNIRNNFVDLTTCNSLSAHKSSLNEKGKNNETMNVHSGINEMTVNNIATTAGCQLSLTTQLNGQVPQLADANRTEIECRREYFGQVNHNNNRVTSVDAEYGSRHGSERYGIYTSSNRFEPYNSRNYEYNNNNNITNNNYNNYNNNERESSIASVVPIGSTGNSDNKSNNNKSGMSMNMTSTMTFDENDNDTCTIGMNSTNFDNINIDNIGDIDTIDNIDIIDNMNRVRFSPQITNSTMFKYNSGYSMNTMNTMNSFGNINNFNDNMSVIGTHLPNM